LEAGGSQNNLARHLKLKHPTVTLELDRQEQGPSDAGNQVPSMEAEPRSLVSVAGQQMITNFIRRLATARKTKHFEWQVLKMIAKGNHAFRIVEEPGFKILIEMATEYPGYKLPQRKTISNRVLNNVYEECKARVRESLCKAYAICLTTMDISM